MERKEWNEALPYAEGAAASYAAWALETSTRCHEMLADWEKAESLIRALSERYEDSAFEWMAWCHRSGHGDVRAATDLARKHFESLGAAATPGQLESIGIFYLLENEPEKALAVFGKAYDRSKNVYDAMHAAIIADTLGNAEERDRNLAKILLAGIRVGPKTVVDVYSRVARLMKASLPPGTMKDFDFKQLDVVLDDAHKGVKRTDTNLKYFVGVFLKNRGDAEKARYYLTRSAQTAQYRWHNQALACRLLREMKAPFVPLGDEKPQADAPAKP